MAGWHLGVGYLCPLSSSLASQPLGSEFPWTGAIQICACLPDCAPGRAGTGSRRRGVPGMGPAWP
jgi:hypothetical protein